MDTSNVINLLLLIVTAIATGLTVTQAIGARKSSRDAGDHERAANAAREEAAAATTRVAELMQEQADRDPDWVVESQGGGHHLWTVTNRTGRVVTAHLEFPEQGPAHVLRAVVDPIWDNLLNPGEALAFSWERRGPGTGLMARIEVHWSAGIGEQERVSRLRAKWPTDN